MATTNIPFDRSCQFGQEINAYLNACRKVVTDGVIRAFLIYCLLSLTAQADVYVSNSGDDAADGATEATAVQSLGVAMSHITQPGERVLLRRGDVFTSTSRIDPYPLCGTAGQPGGIAAYGEGPRPVLQDVEVFWWWNHGPPDAELAHITFADLDFIGVRTGGDKAFLLSGPQHHITFERCRIRGYDAAIHHHYVVAQPYRSHDITLTDCVIADGYGFGLLARETDRLTIQGCVFDRCGHADEMPTKFQHNVYLREPTNLLIENSIFSRGANFGVKCSSDTEAGCHNVSISQCVFYGNAVGLDHSDGHPGNPDTVFTHHNVTLSDCLFEDTRRTFADGTQQDMAFWSLSLDGFTIRDSRFLHKPAFAEHPIVRAGICQNVAMTDNRVSDWSNSSGEGDDWLFLRDQDKWTGLVYSGSQFDTPGLSGLTEFSATHNMTPVELVRSIVDDEAGHTAQDILGFQPAPDPGPDPDPTPEPVLWSVDLQFDPLTWRITGTITPILDQR